MLAFYSITIWLFAFAEIVIPVSGTIGSSCEYDFMCDIDHAYCENRRCTCFRGYKSDKGNQKCIAVVGAECWHDSDCGSLQNSNCAKDVCTCNSGYVPDATKSNCLPIVTIFKGDCQQDNQCKPSFGDYSSCYQSKCSCNPQYHPDTATSYCLLDKGLGAHCTNSSECYTGDNSRNYLECKNYNCKCKAGYSETPDHVCTNNARLILPSLKILSSAAIFIIVSFTFKII